MVVEDNECVGYEDDGGDVDDEGGECVECEDDEGDGCVDYGGDEDGDCVGNDCVDSVHEGIPSIALHCRRREPSIDKRSHDVPRLCEFQGTSPQSVRFLEIPRPARLEEDCRRTAPFEVPRKTIHLYVRVVSRWPTKFH